jgi:hypothetical protein
MAYKSLANRGQRVVATAAGRGGPFAIRQNRLSRVAKLAMIKGGVRRINTGTAANTGDGGALTIWEQALQRGTAVVAKLLHFRFLICDF